MTTPQDTARLRSLSNSAKRSNARLAAIAGEVAGQVEQLQRIIDNIAVEALQPKTLVGKLQRIAGALKATTGEGL